MTLEDRLAEHLRASGDAIRPPQTSVAALTSVSATRTRRMRIIGVVGAVVLAAGALTAVAIGRGVNAVDNATDEPTRVVVSPFVEVADWTQAQPDTELFTVTASEPHYWRLATLDQYEDQIWKLNADFEQTGTETFGVDTGGEPLTQRITVTGMDGIWLPAAAEPIHIAVGDPNIEFDPLGGTLAVPFDFSTSRGLSYTVISQPQRPSPEALAAVANADPLAIGGRYLPVADGPHRQPLADLANELAGDLDQRYETARAVQDHLRGFTVDASEPGIAADPMARLLEQESGSAQQLASAFALMMRELGIPSRVAVGFTWGEPVDTDNGLVTYRVSGRHAHVWPEVHFDLVGWVPFEPTSGRGLPGAAAYTGVAAEQAE